MTKRTNWWARRPRPAPPSRRPFVFPKICSVCHRMVLPEAAVVRAAKFVCVDCNAEPEA